MTYRIVLVDDETSIRRLIRAVLKEHTLFEAADGAKGLALIREVHPDIVLLDMMMPQLNGLQVAQRVSLDPTIASIPIIMLSAKGQAFEKEEAYQSGIKHYLVKPFLPDVLRTTIKKVISEAR
ncbi:MAG TPA: response regulator [Ktedonobacteraceae bacterium]|nr:response regulator [Ktedonobacteraceae bacterium]